MNLRLRKVMEVIEPLVVLEGAGVRLKRSMPTRQRDYLDPFLLFDHFGSDDPADYIAGFPMHPHRGIETVTYMLDGVVEHQDSLGNVGRIGAGDVQWMTSGRGILHQEMPQPREGKMAGFQLWVNLPARFKMTRPRYQEISSAHIPEICREDGVKIRVIAGQVDNVQGPVAEIAADPTYLDISLPAHAAFSCPVHPGHAAFAYVFQGQGALGATEMDGGRTVSHPRLAVLGDGDAFEARTAGQPVRFLLVSGKPLNEPVARYGPFVMNTREEIEQALRDLRQGTFVQ